MNFYETAWLRTGKIIYTGDAMLLAVLKHTTGKDRDSLDGDVVRKLMADINYDTYEPKTK